MYDDNEQISGIEIDFGRITAKEAIEVLEHLTEEEEYDIGGSDLIVNIHR